MFSSKDTFCVSRHFALEMLGMQNFEWIKPPFSLSQEIPTFPSVKENIEEELPLKVNIQGLLETVGTKILYPN